MINIHIFDIKCQYILIVILIIIKEIKYIFDYGCLYIHVYIICYLQIMQIQNLIKLFSLHN